MRLEHENKFQVGMWVKIPTYEVVGKITAIQIMLNQEVALVNGNWYKTEGCIRLTPLELVDIEN